MKYSSVDEIELLVELLLIVMQSIDCKIMFNIYDNVQYFYKQLSDLMSCNCVRNAATPDPRMSRRSRRESMRLSYYNTRQLSLNLL